MEEGEFVSIMGPSGSGKSTLLYTVSGMDSMTAGNVFFDGEDISKLDRKAMAKIRLNKMGFVFQQMYMMKKLNIMDNIVLPGYQAKLKPRSEVNKDAEALMRRLGIIDTSERFITEVSGGQLQRACLCRSLINSPKMIFADEPTGALNQKASMEVINELVKANREGTSVMMVTHSEKVASCSERVIFLVDGNIQGELILGKMESQDDLPVRERKLRNWLQERDW
jgi:putative ABC transport system ATP-binding protein